MAPPTASLSSTRYTIIVDAGSSGSRLIIYSYQDPEAERNEILNSIKDKYQSKLQGKPTGKERDKVECDFKLEMEQSLKRLVKVEKGVKGDGWMQKAEPGISSMSPQNIPAYLAPLMSHALEQIPPSQHHNTPVYVLATAGMRLLDDDTRNDILAATCKTLRSTYPFSVDQANELGPCGDSVRVVSGEEEGMWGWVAVNYLMDGFGHAPHNISPGTLLPLPTMQHENQESLEKDISPTLVDTSHKHPTFGFLDMGGASTQIAFSPSAEELDKSHFPLDDLKSVSLRLLSGQAVEWPLFVASWLGFGTNRVREKYVESKVLEWQKENERISLVKSASDPPLASSTSPLFRPIRDPCLPKGLKLPSTTPSFPPFIGTGSFSQCLEALQPLLDTSAPCPPPSQHCLFAGLPTPHIDFEREDQRGFIGISEYWYTAQQVLGLGGVWDWSEWENGMDGFCQKDWTEIMNSFQKDHGSEMTAVDISRLEMQCFKGAWISNVLHDGIGIPRVTDGHGDQSLTGLDGGELVDEAARRAKEKGLISKQHNSHFQSVDTIGETAVSWTLGKMVIEASKSVKPHGYVAKPVGTNAKWSQMWDVGRGKVYDALGLPTIESKLDRYGVDIFWIFLALTLLVIGLVFTTLRRSRFWLTRGGAHLLHSKRRKQSGAGGDVRDWMRRRPTPTASSLVDQESGLSGTASPQRKWFGPSKFKPWAHWMVTRVPRFISGGHAQKKAEAASSVGGYGIAPSSPNSRASQISLPDWSERYSSSMSTSLPTTPSQNGPTFIPANNLPSDYGLTSEHLSSPSKLKKSSDASRLTPSSSTTSLRPKRSWLNMSSAASSKGASLAEAGAAAGMTTIGGSSGWNDPPVSVFGGVGGLDTGHLGAKSRGPLSRSSSRVNLEEFAKSGLSTMRPLSRGPAAGSSANDPGGP